MSRLRVLQFIAGLDIGALHGGAERFGLELSAALAGQAEVTLCAFWQRDTPAERFWLAEAGRRGVNVRFAARWQGRHALPAYAAGLRAALALCRAVSPDVIHSHFQTGSIAALLARRAGLTGRALRTAHVTREWGLGWDSHLGRALFTRLLFPLGLDGEVGVSPAVVARLDARPLAPRPAVYIPNAIDLAAFRRAARQPLPAQLHLPAGLIVGGVGRLAAQKDPFTLLQAVALLAGRWPELALVWAGDGELRPALGERAQALGLAQRVYLPGFVAGVPALLRRFALLALPSRWEGLPTVILEAMAAGTPVVASDIPGTGDLLRSGVNGWLFPPGDAAALAAQIEQVLSDATRRALVVRQAAAGVVDYDLPHVAQAYLRLWQSPG